MWEDGKRFPDEERPKLPWDEEPEKSGKRRKKAASWERFENAEQERKKIIVFSAVMGVAAAVVLELICSGYIPESLQKRTSARYSGRRGRLGFFLQFFSLFEIAGGLVGAGIGWVIARLLIGY